ncbi:MAG: rod shape-determining protein [Magnetococcales bacterium]|nr:rod shape-determining protein [Magnetococcales bacterium]
MNRLDRSKPLFLGIDLGTSQTAVLSNEGGKELVRSVVGYPKDIIGVRLLNNTKIIGQEALEKRSYMNLHYPLEDGVLKESSDRETKAAKELLEHVISLVNPNNNRRVCGILGVPARASVTNKGQLLKIADELMDLSMVVSEPFMVAYGLNRLTNAIIIDIGAGTVDICAMKGTVPSPEDQITLLKAGNHVDSILVEAIAESYPEVQITPILARKIKEQYGHVGEINRDSIVTLRSNGRPKAHDLSQEIRFACETILPDILESVENLITVFDPEDQEEALKNIILAGGGGQIVGLKKALVEHLKEHGEVDVIRVADPDFAGAAGALKLATELPPDYWTQVGDVIGS